MARPEHDSQLELRVPQTRASTNRLNAPAMPVLDLTSRGPLPAHIEPLLDGGHVASSPPPRGAVQPAAAAEPTTMWLAGGVLMCVCPECDAPMSVRLWLMLADCWRCGTSIELTVEQEQEAKRLWAANQPSSPPPRKTSAAPASPTTKYRGDRRRPDFGRPSSPSRSFPRREPVVTPLPSLAPPKPVVPIPPPPLATARGPDGLAGGQHVTRPRSRVWISDLFQNMPAWLVSLVFHLVLLTLLGLMTFDETSAPTITLSLAVNRYVREGDTDAALARDEARFDMPVGRQRPRSNHERQVLMQAEQDARRLRIDPNTDDPYLPELSRVKQIISSRSNSSRRTLALRDPRVRTELLRREGGTTLTEAAVARGLRWMSLHQQSDGSWSLNRFPRHPDCRGRCNGAGSISSDAAATSLVLLPFLGAGQTHLTGYYQDVVSAGLRWLLEHQQPDGDLRAGSPFYAGMYIHGQATIVLCEALAMTQDETFRQPAQRAVNFIVQAQHPGGGWRYKPRQEGDTSVLGWQLMALQSAKAAGLDVPNETLENAGHYLDRVQHEGGALYAYQPRNRPTPPMTAEGLLCRIYLGWKGNDPGLVQGAAYLLENLPHPRKPNYYYWYYATQTMHHVGGEAWETWNLRMRDVLVQSQETRGHRAGSWAPRGGHAPSGGRLYVTSMAVCALEVYYRHAPIFRQIKLD